MWSSRFKLTKIKNNLKLSFSVTLAIFQICNNPIWLNGYCAGKHRCRTFLSSQTVQLDRLLWREFLAYYSLLGLLLPFEFQAPLWILWDLILGLQGKPTYIWRILPSNSKDPTPKVHFRYGSLGLMPQVLTELLQDIQRVVLWIPSHGKKTYLVAGSCWENWKGSFHPFPPSTIQRTQTTFCVTWVEPHPVSVSSFALSHLTLQEWPWWVKTNRTEDSWTLWLSLFQGLSAKSTEKSLRAHDRPGEEQLFSTAGCS